MRVCTEPGCPQFAVRGNRCELHRKAQRHASDRYRPSARQRGYDSQWERTRGRYLLGHPTCEHPGCTERATDVDHIDGLGPNGPLGHDPRNLRSLCHSHHSQRTARDQPGGWAA